MGMGNMVMLSQVTVYVVVCILSFFIFIPMSVYMSQFDNHCLLFADGIWHNDTSLGVHWSDTGYCNFPIVMSIFTLPLSFFYVLWLSLYLFKDIDLSWLASFVVLITCLLSAVLMVVAGIVLSAGVNKFCSLLTKKLASCEVAQFIGTIYFGDDVYMESFYVELGMAQFGAWCSAIGWIILTGIASYKLYTFHKQEDFFISMRRERERLIQRVSRSENV